METVAEFIARSTDTFEEVFRGDRDPAVFQICRETIVCFLGEFVYTLEQTMDHRLYVVIPEERIVRGLHPTTPEELCVFMIYVLNEVLPEPYVSTLRELIDFWVERNPCRVFEAEIFKFLNEIGFQ